ncbi:MFS transporter [Paenibacillus durus]|uniref:MFS transporter n=1 Tax=Paenibacillus durus TaxID=44251 RepID=UPI00398848A2
MVPEALKGRALAIAMVGTPIALTFGVPFGTLLGDFIGWRAIFGLMSLLALVLIGWVLWRVPDFPGQPANQMKQVRNQNQSGTDLSDGLVFLFAETTIGSSLASSPLVLPWHLADRAFHS